MIDQPRRVLITGTTGLIGGAVARRWSALGLGRVGEVHVRALVRSPQSKAARALAECGVELVQGDLNDPATLARAVDGCAIVVHAAAETGLIGPMKIWKSNVEATRALYEAASTAGVERFLFISTMNVYGQNSPASEETPPEPCGEFYADAKLAAELCLNELADGPDRPRLTILRIPAVYGPGVPQWTMQPLAQARRRSLTVTGAGDSQFAYLYMENLVDALTAAVTSEAAGIFNIYDGVTTLADFLGCYAVMARTRLRRRSLGIMRAKLRVKEWLGWLVGIYPAQNQRALAILHRAGEISPRAEKAARELNWHPRFSLEEGMAAVRLAHFPEKPQEPHNAWQENETWVEKKDPTEPG